MPQARRVPVTRLAFSSRHVAGAGATFRLRPAAFLPYHGTMSVFRIDGLDETQIWKHLAAHASRPDRRFHGRGDFRLSDLAGRPLKLDLDDTPPRHGNVIGWPAAKDRRLALARELAEMSNATPPPEK